MILLYFFKIIQDMAFLKLYDEFFIQHDLWLSHLLLSVQECQLSAVEFTLSGSNYKIQENKNPLRNEKALFYKSNCSNHFKICHPTYSIEIIKVECGRGNVFLSMSGQPMSLISICCLVRSQPMREDVTCVTSLIG